MFGFLPVSKWYFFANALCLSLFVDETRSTLILFVGFLTAHQRKKAISAKEYVDNEVVSFKVCKRRQIAYVL
jgi:hypothetical protein